MNNLFLKACRREEVERTPVWFMRQAGRFLPEYRKIREKYDMLAIIRKPELSVQVSLLPLKYIPVDAVILFSDIMTPLEAAGISWDLKENVGPVIQNPIRSSRDVEGLHDIEPEEDLSYVLETIRLLRNELDGEFPLIGFSGAPFTLASYLIEGGSSRGFTKTKKLMYQEPTLWHSLMEKLSLIVERYLRAKIIHGVDAIQVFDSWVGCLSPEDYREYVQPYSRSVFKRLGETSVPSIHFGTGTTNLLELMKETGGDVIGIDWRIPLDLAWERIGFDVGIQGNLDPAILLGPPERIENRTNDILRRANGRPGHIFNLGHGILPDTPMDNVKRVVDFVHAYSNKDTI
jgi:uroporphyrinogen decarboxylase